MRVKVNSHELFDQENFKNEDSSIIDELSMHKSSFTSFSLNDDTENMDIFQNEFNSDDLFGSEYSISEYFPDFFNGDDLTIINECLNESISITPNTVEKKVDDKELIKDVPVEQKEKPKRKKVVKPKPPLNSTVPDPNRRLLKSNAEIKKCLNELKSIDKMITHVLYKPNNGFKYRCKYCSYSFDNDYEFFDHISKHPNVKYSPYQCNFCTYKVYSKSSIINHLKDHCVENPFHCDFCTATFETKEMMKQHRDQHKEVMPCKLCNWGFLEYRELVKHLISTHDITNVKVLSELSTSTNSATVDSSTIQKIENHQDNKQVEGDKQGGVDEVKVLQGKNEDNVSKVSLLQIAMAKGDSLIFDLYGSLDRNNIENKSKKTKYSPDLYMYFCRVCSGDYDENGTKKISKETSNTNAVTAHPNREYFKCISSVKKHISTNHPKIQPWICLNCSFKTKNPSILVLHNKAYHSEEFYNCKECNRIFENEIKYMRHLERHRQNINCPICKMKFAYQEQYDVHALEANCKEHKIEIMKAPIELPKVHKFNCSKCSMSYSSPSLLSDHMETHTPDKSFNCAMCQAYFDTRRNLEAHYQYSQK